DMLPELLVSPPWMTKEKKKNTPVFDLPVLPVPSVSDVTPEITKKTDPYLPCHPLPANSPTAGDKTNIVYRPAADQKSKLGETLNTAYTGATNTVASWF
ncbi:hypothetical protein U5C32_RS23515, partial [Escherichia coli]